MVWNPNTPDVIGLEWFPTQELSRTLESITSGALVQLPSLAAENIDEVRAYITSSVTSANFVLDVFAEGSEIPGAQSTITARPNEDVTKTNVWDEAHATTNIYASIDEVTTNDADYIVGITSSGWLYRGRVGSGGGLVTGKRILQVKLVARMWVDALTTNPSCVGGLTIGGVDYAGTEVALPDGAYTSYTHTWLYNPATGLPWTIANIEAFDTTDSCYIENTTATDAEAIRCTQLQLDFLVVTENRVATGQVPSSASGWTTIPVTTPTGGTWAKANATTYSYLIHKIPGSSAASLVLPYIEDVDLAHPIDEVYVPTIGNYGTVSALGSALNQSHGLIPRVTTPADSGDSQPYASLDSEAVYTGRTIEQEFQGIAGDYGLIACVIAHESSTSPDADLLVKIRRRSDNVQVGGTLTIEAADLSAPRSTLQKLLGSLASSATLAAVQYYVEFSSSATSGTGWIVAVLNTEGQGNAQNYGGTTDAATVATVESADKDVPLTVSTVPDAPTNFAVDVLST